MTPRPHGGASVTPRDGRHALELLADGQVIELPKGASYHPDPVPIVPTRGQVGMARAFRDDDPLAAIVGTHRGRPAVFGTLGGGRAGAGNTPPNTWPRHYTILSAGGSLLDLSERMRDGDHWRPAHWSKPRDASGDGPTIRPAKGQPRTAAQRLDLYDAHVRGGAPPAEALRALARLVEHDPDGGALTLGVARRLADLARHLGADPAAPIEGLPPGAPYARVAVIAFGDDPDRPSVVVGPLPADDARALARWLAGVST